MTNGSSTYVSFLYHYIYRPKFVDFTFKLASQRININSGVCISVSTNRACHSRATLHGLSDHKGLNKSQRSRTQAFRGSQSGPGVACRRNCGSSTAWVKAESQTRYGQSSVRSATWVSQAHSTSGRLQRVIDSGAHRQGYGQGSTTHTAP